MNNISTSKLTRRKTAYAIYATIFIHMENPDTPHSASQPCLYQCGWEIYYGRVLFSNPISRFLGRRAVDQTGHATKVEDLNPVTVRVLDERKSLHPSCNSHTNDEAHPYFNPDSHRFAV